MGWIADPKPLHTCDLPPADSPGMPKRWQCELGSCALLWERKQISDQREGTWWHWSKVDNRSDY